MIRFIQLSLTLCFLLFQLSSTQAQTKPRVETVPAEYIVKKLGLKVSTRLSANNLAAVSKTSNGLRAQKGFKFVKVPVSTSKGRFTVLAVIPPEFKTFKSSQLSSSAKNVAIYAGIVEKGTGGVRQIGNSVSCSSRECKFRQLSSKDQISANDILVVVPSYKY